MCSLLFLMDYLIHFCIALFFKKPPLISRKVKQDKVQAQSFYYKNRKKAQWVIDKVLYIKAISDNGCGKVEELFNQLYGDRETVSKTYVYTTLLKHQYELVLVRRKLKSKPPKKVAINLTWGMDLTKVSLSKQQKLILGIVDHGSRLNLKLSELSSKHSAKIVLELIEAIRQFGFPTFIRTDNEACFNSKWFKLCFKLLGIKHQKTKIAAPWVKEAFYSKHCFELNERQYKEVLTGPYLNAGKHLSK